MRPLLTLMAYNLYREDIERVLKSAIGIEIFHNYTLLHDDVMDDAELRRGRLTVHKKWNSNVAILSGDAAAITAYQCIEHCEDKYLRRAIVFLIRWRWMYAGDSNTICCLRHGMTFRRKNI